MAVKGIRFAKLSGTGNDFVIVDNRHNTLKNASGFAKIVCDRKRSIGADGVLLVENSKCADLKMRIINADGSEAEMCGNGIRCFGLFAFLKKMAAKKMKVETLAGIKEVEIKNASSGLVNVNMGAPKDIRPGLKSPVNGKVYTGYFANTGVPHAVIFAKNIDVFKTGKAVRFHKIFKPAGTNANFVEVLGKKSIKVRTYERGVEGETLACGTGSTAAAFISSILGKVDLPVKVVTSGGELLTISSDGKNGLCMAGKVTYICDGTLN